MTSENNITEWATVVVAIVSAIVSLYALSTSQRAIRVSEETAKSDFQAVEDVKSDLAQLIAALDAIMIKGAVYSQQAPAQRDLENTPSFVDISSEQAKIENFLHKSSSIAFRTFAAEKSKNASEKGLDGEEWRIFFIRVVDILHANNPMDAARKSAIINRMLGSLSRNDISKISEYLSDLPASLQRLFEEREHDPLMAAFLTEPVNESSLSKDQFSLFITFLRDSKNIDDPDLDLFWATINENEEVLKSAIDRGADLSITDTKLVEKYSDYVHLFNK